MVPWVPTGMKTGVSTTWWGRTMRPTRALVVLHRATISYCSGPAAAAVAGAPALAAAAMAAMVRRGRPQLLRRLSALAGYPKRRRAPSIDVAFASTAARAAGLLYDVIVFWQENLSQKRRGAEWGRMGWNRRWRPVSAGGRTAAELVFIARTAATGSSRRARAWAADDECGRRPGHATAARSHRQGQRRDVCFDAAAASWRCEGCGPAALFDRAGRLSRALGACC